MWHCDKIGNMNTRNQKLIEQILSSEFSANGECFSHWEWNPKKFVQIFG